MAQEALIEWIHQQQERRGWSGRELARHMELPHSTVNRIFQDGEYAGLKVCLALARVFGVPIINVLELAELVPRRPPTSRESDLLHEIYSNLPRSRQMQLIEFAEFLRDTTELPLKEPPHQLPGQST